MKVLSSLGFVTIRQRVSHLIMQHPDGRTTIIPIHNGEDIHKGLLRTIIHEIGIDKELFISMVDNT
ncbi:MAG: addiction module toxin, HicA family [Methanomicrobiales archaeon]|nr:addiction module toxin, HicA family [Methanomicrobiales archaeon]